MKRTRQPDPCVKTHPRQRPADDLTTFQGKPVLAVQHGMCMHCKVDLVTLLVQDGTARRWINTPKFGAANTEHTCSRAAT